MSKAEQVNQVIKPLLGELIASEVETPDFLITVYNVKCAQDLSSAKVHVSILPEKFSGTALKRLRAKSGHLSKILKAKSGLNRVPKLFWYVDSSFKAVEKINNIFDEIEREKEDVWYLI